MLKIKNIKHNVLNAKQHQREAEIVAEAGQPGTVTIATNMAGRGTDIKLTPVSRNAGGLAIVGTERHESRRVDRQLRGRSGRQGDPGSTQFFVSLEDNLMRLFGSDRIAKLMDRMGHQEGDVIQHSMITKSIERAQKKVEENNFSIRKRLLEYDDVMNSQREVIYKRRRNALYGERLHVDILNMLFDTCEDIIMNGQSSGNYENFKLNCLSSLSVNTDISETQLLKDNPTELVKRLYNEANDQYQKKNLMLKHKTDPVFSDLFEKKGGVVESVMVPFTDGTKQLNISTNLKKLIEPDSRELVNQLEKSATLSIIDQAWKEHLRDMDDLKQSVQNAVYEQKDPLLVYKFEAFNLFKAFISKINEEIISFLLRADIPVQSAEEVQEARQARLPKQKYVENKEEAGSSLGSRPSTPSQVEQEERIVPVKSKKIANRNDRVSVQYMDGSVKKDVKYKTVEEDVLQNRCVIIDEEE
jgi:preprotein translocase subunit SecA